MVEVEGGWCPSCHPADEEGEEKSGEEGGAQKPAPCHKTR